MDTVFYFQDLFPALNQGLLVSLALIAPSACMGLLVGIGVGTTRAFGGPFASGLARGYAALFRGTPLVVQLFVLYFGLPNVGIYLSPYVAAVIGFTLCSGAYHSEYIRGGLLSIKKGQVAAAQSLGFSTWKTMRHVVVPQALRRALPGCGNELIYLIKYSSLAYIITCIELTGEGKVMASRTFRFTEVFMIVGLYYLVLVSLASMGLHWLERRLELPGFGHSRG
ncbi:MAG: amino acid ABC transporter permease [Desulfovermiculus sp.]|nr:amino acid ABC transporter permease [Desulfovermiculus sp.]